MSDNNQQALAELDELLASRAQGELSSDERSRLEALVRDNEPARKRYLSYTAVESQLHGRSHIAFDDALPADPRSAEATQASKETPTIRADGTDLQPADHLSRSDDKTPYSFAKAAGLLLAAACIAVAVVTFWPGGNTRPVDTGSGSNDSPSIAINDVAGGTDGSARAVAVVSSFGDVIKRDNWRMLPGKNADYEVVSDKRVILKAGEIYVATTGEPAVGGERLQIETADGTITPIGTRFFVSTPGAKAKPDHRERSSSKVEGKVIESALEGDAMDIGLTPPSEGVAVSSPNNEARSSAPRSIGITAAEPQPSVSAPSAVAGAGSATRVFVLAGAVTIANDFGENKARAGEGVEAEQGKAPRALKDEGNYKEAFDVYRKLVTAPEHGGEACAEDIRAAIACLQRLNRLHEWDDLAEQVAAAHPNDWRVLRAVAVGYQQMPHYGSIIDNVFVRNNWRGQRVNTTQRDRRRALQLFDQAMPFAAKDKDRNAVGHFYRDFASSLGTHEAWRLQLLTDLTALPDYGDPIYHDQTGGAPVDENGKPVFHALPKTWKVAASDGERWRFLLEQMANADPTLAHQAMLIRADFLFNQFGVQTMGWAPRLDKEGELEAGPYAVHTLKDNETIARLATGVERFELPDEHNFVHLYKTIAKDLPEKIESPLKDVTFSVFEGNWNPLPEFEKLKPTQTGESEDNLLDLSMVKLRSRFGVVFEGTLVVPKGGEYTVTVECEEIAHLKIGDVFSLELKGTANTGVNQRSGKLRLEAGDIPVRFQLIQGPHADQNLRITLRDEDDKVYHLSGQGNSSVVSNAIERLARIYQNRLQYDKAAAQWETVIGHFGPGNNGYRRKQLSQIVDPWGRIDSTKKMPHGKDVELSYIFRNGDKVSFTAKKIKLELLIADMKAYLKSNPNNIEWNYRKVNLDAIGQRLVRENEVKYLGKQAAAWQVELKPRAGHWDRRVAVDAPLEEPGAYLLEAKMAGGNTSRVIVWITDTALVAKPVDGGTMYFVADAATGEPIADANVEFFGYRQKYLSANERTRDRRQDILTRNFSDKTNADGIVAPEAGLLDRQYRWLAIARTDGANGSGRFGVLGFNNVWRMDYNDRNYQAAKAYTFTDRPVYRPGQQVHFKAWVRAARYDMAFVSHFAGRNFRVRVFDPRNQVVFDKHLTANDYGAVDGAMTLDSGAALGRYRVQVTEKGFVDPFTNKRIDREHHLGGANFRVEEYKKPEYEVAVDAPGEPIKLGDAFEATVKAEYYFGGPVTNAQVKYTVKRTEHANTWIPPRPWDWLYGPGYWWFGYEARWHPQWDDWGCGLPGWFRPNPPEVVAQDVVPIGADGTVKIRIDSSVAKELFGHLDHRYTVTAEVIDESRRTIVGSGSVIAAREPFKVYAWFDGGHYRVGDTIEANFRARTPDGKPVEGKGTVLMYAINSDKDGKVTETLEDEWKVDVDASGAASIKIKAAKTGQYRIACKVISKKGLVREGAALTVVTGDKKIEGGFQFNDLEIAFDKAEYAVGDQARLLVSTNREDSTVLLFVRPAGGVYRKPEVVRGAGKTIMRSIDITQSDMPNIFVEAVTIADGQVHAESKQIVVPPTKRVLTVDVEPSGTKFEPKENAKVKIKLTDIHGKPFAGETVVSVYDKSLEYIGGPMAAADIREFFWKWQRHHYPNNQHNLAKKFGELLKDGETPMATIGAFGSLLHVTNLGVNETVALGYSGQMRSRDMNSAERGGGGLFAADEMADAVASDAAPEAKMAEGNGGGGSGGAMPAVEARTDFADSAYWTGSVVTNSNGIAEIEIPMPENLTTWKIHAWGLGHGTVVGQGVAEVITSKDLLVRLQAPRFFVEKDEVVLSANIHNYTDDAQDVKVAIDLRGNALDLLKGSDQQTGVTIDAGHDKRVDWRVKVKREGEAVVQMSAVAGAATDAMEMTFPSFVHGMLKTDSYSAAIRPDAKNTKLTVTVPKERRPEQTRLEVRFSPSIALAMVDALPYLRDYEYRHSESAVSRFLPLVTTRKLLGDMGIDLEAVKDKQINLNPQEVGDAQERAKQWRKHPRINPVFDNAEVDRITRKSLSDLAGMQHRDGGFAWLAGSRPDAHATAYAVHGLLLARDADVALVPGMLERGVQWLANHQKKEVQELVNAKTKKKPWKTHADNLDAFIAMVLCEAGKPNKQMLEFLYRDRLKLSVYAMAMAGLSFDMVKQNEERDMVVRNIKQYMVEDEENQTAYLRLPADNYWWRWYGSSNEAHAYFLKLLTRVEPKGETAAGLAKYLLNNRKHATWWTCTRDTALAIEALGAFVRASDEQQPDMDVILLVDGEEKKRIHIDADNLFTFENTLVMTGEDLSAGKHTIEVRRDGKGPVYVNAYLTNFRLEDFITKAGLEVKVERRFYKLVEKDLSISASGSRGQATGYKVEKYRRVPLVSGDQLTSGDLVEVELLLESKNDYEHLLFEDFKAAGLEPIALNSGYVQAGGTGAYMELRDEKVAFLIRRLPRGKHSLTYQVRAEIPGKFSALPTKAQGVYAAELRANSDEMKLEIKDR